MAYFWELPLGINVNTIWTSELFGLQLSVNEEDI